MWGIFECVVRDMNALQLKILIWLRAAGFNLDDFRLSTSLSKVVMLTVGCGDEGIRLNVRVDELRGVRPNALGASLGAGLP